MGFQLVPKSVTLTLNDVMAIILCYFAEFGRFCGNYEKECWSVDCLSINVIKYTNYKHDGRAVLFAVADRTSCLGLMYEDRTQNYDPEFLIHA